MQEASHVTTVHSPRAEISIITPTTPPLIFITTHTYIFPALNSQTPSQTHTKMALKFNCILAVTLLAVVVASLFFHASAALGGGGLPGGWSPITDTKDPQVVEIGKFAVNEYNKQAKTNLVFKRVKKGATQVVAGTNYRLVISANDGGRSNNRYLAVVWEKPWENFRNLTSFKKL